MEPDFSNLMLALAYLPKDLQTQVINEVKKEADMIIEKDPFLTSEKYIGLRNRVTKLFGEKFTLKL